MLPKKQSLIVDLAIIPRREFGVYKRISSPRVDQRVVPVGDLEKNEKIMNI